MNTSLAQAASLKIRTKVLVEESDIQLSDLDLYSLMGNLLNNAIEALSKLPEEMRDLYIELSRKGGYTAILVRNRVLSSVLADNPNLKTTKENADHHGFGIRIIRDVAERNGGMTDIFEQDGYFTVQVLIPGGEEDPEDE